MSLDDTLDAIHARLIAPERNTLAQTDADIAVLRAAQSAHAGGGKDDCSPEENLALANRITTLLGSCMAIRWGLLAPTSGEISPEMPRLRERAEALIAGHDANSERQALHNPDRQIGRYSRDELTRVLPIVEREGAEAREIVGELERLAKAGFPFAQGDGEVFYPVFMLLAQIEGAEYDLVQWCRANGTA